MPVPETSVGRSSFLRTRRLTPPVIAGNAIEVKSPYQSADAYVIALAQIRNGVVVSQETSAAEKRKPPRDHYIPDVCRELGVPCINLLGLMRRERWEL